MKKEKVQQGDIFEIKKYQSAKTGLVFKETRAMFVDFGDQVIALDNWDDNLRFPNNSDYDVIAHKRLTPEEAKYCTPQNHYCAKNVQDRYKELGLKQDVIKRSLR